MKKIISIILVVISSLLFIGGGLLLTTNSSKKEPEETHKEEQKNDKEDQEEETKKTENIAIEDLSSMSEEELKEPDITIANELIKLSKKVYENDNDIELNGVQELFISIKDFKETHNLDVNVFSTLPLVCNEEKTGIKFIKQDNKIYRIPILNCT